MLRTVTHSRSRPLVSLALGMLLAAASLGLASCGTKTTTTVLAFDQAIIDQIDDMDGFERALKILDRRNGALDRGGIAHENEFVGHESAGRVLLEAQQFANIFRLLLPHIRQDLCRSLGRHLL